jgi:hypothetical protein
MYGIFTYIYPQNGPNVGKYSIHGAYWKGDRIKTWLARKKDEKGELIVDS